MIPLKTEVYLMNNKYLFVFAFLSALSSLNAGPNAGPSTLMDKDNPNVIDVAFFNIYFDAIVRLAKQQKEKFCKEDSYLESAMKKTVPNINSGKGTLCDIPEMGFFAHRVCRDVPSYSKTPCGKKIVATTIDPSRRVGLLKGACVAVSNILPELGERCRGIIEPVLHLK